MSFDRFVAKTLPFVSTLAFGMAMTALIIIVWWSRPVRVLEISKPIEITGDKFTPGNFLQYKLNYCKSPDIEADTSYAFVDSVKYATPGKTTHRLIPGCHEVIEGVSVPNIPTGTYQLEMTRVYLPSPFRRVEVRSLSNFFVVVNGK